MILDCLYGELVQSFIENNLIVKAFITECTDLEHDVAIKVMDSLKENLTINNLSLFDHGYPSFDFFAYLLDLKVKFIIRTPVGHCKSSSIQSSVSDQIFEHKRKRVVLRFTL